MTRHTARKALVVASAVAGLMMGGAGTAAADHGDDDFRFDDHGRFDDRFFFNRGFDCFGPFCFVFDDRHGGPGRH
jgi:hypothetical protein